MHSLKFAIKNNLPVYICVSVKYKTQYLAYQWTALPAPLPGETKCSVLNTEL